MKINARELTDEMRDYYGPRTSDTCMLIEAGVVILVIVHKGHDLHVTYEDGKHGDESVGVQGMPDSLVLWRWDSERAEHIPVSWMWEYGLPDHVRIQVQDDYEINLPLLRRFARRWVDRWCEEQESENPWTRDVLDELYEINNSMAKVRAMIDARIKVHDDGGDLFVAWQHARVAAEQLKDTGTHAEQMVRRVQVLALDAQEGDQGCQPQKK